MGTTMDSKTALSLMEKNNSQLCIGLDLNLKHEDRLSSALEIIDLTHDLAAAFKPNRQFWLGFTLEDMRELNSRIKKYNCFSIIDHKLSDIGSSNTMALQRSKDEGFDMITVSPFPGNLISTCEVARNIGIGVIALVVMSNPEAKWMIDKNFIEWVKDAELVADGIVVGTTNHITSDIIEKISKIASSPIVLAPGLGHQKGKISAIHRFFKNRALYNVSRGISESKDKRAAAENFYQQISELTEG